MGNIVSVLSGHSFFALRSMLEMGHQKLNPWMHCIVKKKACLSPEHKRDLRVKRLWQTGHWYGFSPLCERRCLVKLRSVSKERPHWGQGYWVLKLSTAAKATMK